MTVGYDTPEEAALSGWTAASNAYVIETRYERDVLAKVLVDTEPSHPMLVTCERKDGKWTETSDQWFYKPWPRR